MASLEVLESKLDDVAADVAEIKRLLENQNGRLRHNEQCIAVLQEQQRARTGLLLGVQVIVGAVASWLGISH
jgi:hypothetical protein